MLDEFCCVVLMCDLLYDFFGVYGFGFIELVLCDECDVFVVCM